MIAKNKALKLLPKNVETLSDADGNNLFEKRLKKLNKAHQVRIKFVIELVKQGLPVKVRGLGKISEIVISHPTKLRIYYKVDSETTYLLSVGTEGKQSVDIKEAEEYWLENK